MFHYDRWPFFNSHFAFWPIQATYLPANLSGCGGGTGPGGLIDVEFDALRKAANPASPLLDTPPPLLDTPPPPDAELKSANPTTQSYNLFAMLEHKWQQGRI